VASAHNISTRFESDNSSYNYDARFINYVCTEFDPDCLLRRGELIRIQQNTGINRRQVSINDHWLVADSFALDLGAQYHYNNYTDESFVHPRLATTWQLTPAWTLTSSAGRYDRLPDIDKTLPVAGNRDLKSPRSNHFTLGIKHDLAKEWSWSITSYYKTMSDLPLASPVGTTPLYTNNVDGRAYGVDIFINKGQTDNWYGWLAISASKSTRINDITEEKSNYYLDTPLVINWVMNYQLNKRWTFGSRFILQSGRAYTPITGVQENPYFEDKILPIYGEPYSDNLPIYSRLDLRFKREMTLFGFSGSCHIEVLNAFNRRNVTDRTLDYKRTTSTDSFKTEDEVGLGIIPALGMSIVF
jgi:TonB dependent receptor